MSSRNLINEEAQAQWGAVAPKTNKQFLTVLTNANSGTAGGEEANGAAAGGKFERRQNKYFK